MFILITRLCSQATRRDGGGDGNVEVRLLFHHTVVGCIIGKGGAKIKELREVRHEQIFIQYIYSFVYESMPLVILYLLNRQQQLR